jgi:cobalt-zinc-cadmium resistance protein CzcA
VIIVENTLRRIAERQHHKGRTLDIEERLSTVAASAREMIRPSVYGQAIIILVYVPLLTLSGVEGKTFTPMALTVILASSSPSSSRSRSCLPCSVSGFQSLSRKRKGVS